MNHRRNALGAPLMCSLLLSLQSLSAQPNFLTLPFADQAVLLTEGWLYQTPGSFECEPAGRLCHRGLDYAHMDGAKFDVLAAADGRAVATWTMNHYGFFIYIAHDEVDSSGQQYFTLYAHVEENSWQVPFRTLQEVRTDLAASTFSDWGEVSRGDLVARSGMTGSADSIHLHFEAQLGEYPRNKTDPYGVYGIRDEYQIECGAPFLWRECPPNSPSPIPLVPDKLAIIEFFGKILSIVDLDTGQVSPVGQIGYPEVAGLAFDRLSGTLFTANNTGNGQLISIDLKTGAGAPRGGPLGEDIGNGVHDLTFGPNNELFAITNIPGSNSRLVKIDTVSGAATAIGGIIAPQLSGLAYDAETDRMYTTLSLGPGSLYEIDPDTAEIWVVRQIGPRGVGFLADRPATDVFFALRVSSFQNVTTLGTLDPSLPLFVPVANLGPAVFSVGIEMVTLP